MSQSPSAAAKKPGSFKQPAQSASGPEVSKPASRQRRKARLLVTHTTAESAPHAKPLPAAKAAQPARAGANSPPSRKPAAKEKKMSALDAAATVLASLPANHAAQGLSAGDLITKMEAGKLWTSAAGKTPSATLYAAMMREITLKGSQSRFCRPAAGRFALLGTQAKGKIKDAAVKVKASKGAKA
ncbi:MAG: HTH domain-containing protein [Phycisphaerales bacterium]|nr:HTH domain-containing protein [Phycisphaerales bacterium]